MIDIWNIALEFGVWLWTWVRENQVWATLGSVFGIATFINLQIIPRFYVYRFLLDYHGSKRRALREFFISVRWPLGTLRAIDRARLRTEFEILSKPMDDQPRRRRMMYARMPFKLRLKLARDERAQLKADRKAWNAKCRQRKGALDDLMLRLAAIAEKSKENLAELTEEQFVKEVPVILIDTPAFLDDVREDIERYFRSLGALPSAPRENFGVFLAYVRIGDGYAASAFLIHGLMSRFKDDWQPIVRNYRKTLGAWTTGVGYSRELDEIRSFQFNCWLLWGPSIPLCTCSLWRDKSSVQQAKPRTHIMQYGFGDEANCVDFMIDSGEAESSYRAWQDSVQSKKGGEPRHVGAIYGALHGQIMWGPNIPRDRICDAQRLAIVGHNESSGRVVLKFAQRVASNRTDDTDSLYYSAYVWVIFAMRRRNGTSFHPPGHRNLLPFFEHANIADATTLQTIKENLVAKSISALIESIVRDGDDDVIFEYVSASDHSGCGSEILFPPTAALPPEISPSGVEPEEARPPRILDLLRMARDRHSLLVNEEKFGFRLQLPPTAKSKTFDNGRYASCHLPEIVEQFFDELASQNKSAEEMRYAAKI